MAVTLHKKIVLGVNKRICVIFLMEGVFDGRVKRDDFVKIPDSSLNFLAALYSTLIDGSTPNETLKSSEVLTAFIEPLATKL
uniref:Uncharacterized protein n=1 Tax=Romanomermis culicivorax TaxID=13658 RepID=A0A915KWN2_ROMCU